MWGPSEMTVVGSLKDWTAAPIMKDIKVPTLLMNGAEDEATDLCVRPYFRGLSNVKWITLDNAAHFSHVDQREKTMVHVANFLAD